MPCGYVSGDFRNFVETADLLVSGDEVGDGEEIGDERAV